jgi:hypothetical protein
MSECFAEREPSLEIQQRIPEDLVGDLVGGMRLPPDDLNDRAQSPLVMAGGYSGSLGSILEGTPMPRQNQPRLEPLDLRQ